jgi:hypothetical protein
MNKTNIFGTWIPSWLKRETNKTMSIILAVTDLSWPYRTWKFKRHTEDISVITVRYVYSGTALMPKYQPCFDLGNFLRTIRYVMNNCISFRNKFFVTFSDQTTVRYCLTADGHMN